MRAPPPFGSPRRRKCGAPSSARLPRLTSKLYAELPFCTQANPFACIAAGIASLWGPAHGGANEAVLRMLGEIGSEENIPAFIARAKDKTDPFRLMGFGHRVSTWRPPPSVAPPA
eukprot:scaffold38330_cov31-Tisochrysis_lutea.AAC.5